MIDESHHEILFYDGKKTFMAIEKKRVENGPLLWSAEKNIKNAMWMM